MAQTIPTPGSDAVVASQPLPAGEFPGLVDALGLTEQTTKLSEGFSGLSSLKLSEPMTDSEKALENPFLKLPKANPKDFVDTVRKDWEIGQEGVNIDMATDDFATQVLTSGQPGDYSQLQDRRKALAKSQYFNQADNLVSRAVHGTVQMLPPMAQGQLSGIEKGVERGMQMGLIGSSGFVAGPEVGAPMVTAFTGVGVAGGNLEGSFNYWTKQGRGASFAELVDAGVNQVTAANIAQFVGPAYAAIEYAQVGKLVDIVGGKELKGGLLRGAMQQLAKIVPAGAKVAAEKVAQVSARPLVKGAVDVAGDILVQAGEEAAQGAVSQAGTEYGRSQQQLIAQGARDGAMEVLANLDLPEASKQVLSRGFDEFASSIGPMAVLTGGAKGTNFLRKASWDGFVSLAKGDIQKAADQREAIAKSGAPQTAQALAETLETEPSSVKPTAATVTPTAPVVAPIDEPALDAELEAAGQAPVEVAEPEAPKPTVGLPGDELGARIFSNIRARKPIAKTDLDQVGGFSLSADWKLNEETGNYEYQGPVYERKEAPQVPVAKAEVEPITKPETKAPEAKAVAPVEAVKPEPAQKGAEAVAPTLEQPKIEAPKVEAPKVEAPVLPRWEEVQKNKDQIKFLKSVFKKANAKLTKEQQVTPKVGWKRKDFYSALERMYGQLTQLEFKQPEQIVPPAPKVGQAPKPTAINEAEQRRKLKLANLLKVFGNKDLDGDQTLFRDIAMAQARKVASQIATQFQNLTDPDGEIYNGLISAIATRLKKSVDQKTPVFFNEAGEPIAINDESVKKWLMKAADRAGRDTARRQAAQREINIEFGGKPAEGVVTQPEAAKEEAKPEGMQVKEVAPEEKEEPRGIRAIREAAQAIREQSSPEAKLVLDWVVSQLVGEDSALGKIKTYKDLAAYLSKVAKRTISDKRVGLTVNDVVKKLADNLSEIGIKVNVEALEMALSPEGQKAKERLAAEEAKAKASRDERTAKANLSDRARNLRSGYAVKERLVDAVASATPENRARIQNEVVALAEEDLLADDDINNRLDNIEKGLPNEKPAIGQPVSRRGRRGVKQAKEGEVLGGTGEGVEGARGTTSPVATTEGQPQPGARGAEPVGARPSGAGQQVGGKQQTATGNVSVDVRLSENNRSPAVKTLVQTATSNGVPVTLQDSPESGSAVGVDTNQVEGQEVPIIRVNQNKLKEVRRTLGPKAFAEWSWRAINQEIIHFRHLKLLERLAKEEGTDYKSYLKKEAKRIVQIIKRQRGLRKRIEAIYNNGEKMDDFNLAFEFTRMLVEEKMMGGITESSYMDIAKVLNSVDAEGRGFIFRFMELVRDLMYGLTGRTAAETKFLRATADAIISEQRKVMRDLYNPTEKLPVQVNFYTPKEKVIVGSAADRKASEEEIKQDSGLNRASMPFLREYARELGIKEPMGQRKMEVRDQKTGKIREQKVSFPVWKKPDYVKAIKEKLKELGKKPKELGAAMPMRFKTEYAFRQIDRSFGSKRGIFKGLTVDSNNTLPWENLKAKIIKGTSKAEANWVLPSMEALVRNGRVDVDMAVEALQALAKNKVTVKELEEPSQEDTANQPEDIRAALKFSRALDEIRHDAETQFRLPSKALANAKRLISLDGYDIFSQDNIVKGPFYEFKLKAEIEELSKTEMENLDTQKVQEVKGKLADAYASFAKDLYVADSRDYTSQFGRSQVEAINRAYYITNNLKDGDEQQKAFAKIGLYISGGIDLSEIEEDPRASARYSMANPKPVREMRELREILVKTPIGEVAGQKSHFEDKDVVGFGRMYTTQQGEKTITFLFEAQTDASTSPRGELADENHPMTVMDFTPVFEAELEDLKNALQEIVGEKRPIYVDELGNLAYPTLDLVPSKYTIARNKEGNLYEVNGDLGFSLLEKSRTDRNLADKVRPNLKDSQTASLVEWDRMLTEAAPLVSAYESLVLKNAIADAVARNHDSIAITDDETAAMTEGHSKVNDGMRAHYGARNGSLHNLARKLTGDDGTPFNDGRSTYAYEEERNDLAESPLTPYRYKKAEVTGVSYSLDKVKALGEESDIYNILGAALPTDRPYWLKDDGEVLDVEENALIDMNSIGSHSEAAVQFLQENDPENPFLMEWSLLDPLQKKDRQQLPVQEMFNKGWLRVIGDGFNLFFEGTPNKTQLDKLFEAAIEDEVKLIHDKTGLSGRPKSKLLYEPPLEDELNAAMPRRGFASSEPRFSQSWKALPDSVAGLTEVYKMKRGTNDVRLYRDEMGDTFVIKRGQSQEQFENEVAADNVYRILNYPVPPSRLITDENGETAKIANYIAGPILADFQENMAEADPEAVKTVFEELGDGLLIDAFLFNYDVLGEGLDNIVVAHEEVTEEDGLAFPEPLIKYTAYRIDNGGTLDTRAMGLKRDEPFFYDSFSRLADKYPQFNLTATDLVAQLSDIVLNSDAILNAIPARLRPMMAQRIQWMADQLSAVDTIPSAIGYSDEEVTAHFAKLAKEMDSIKVVRNAQGELINEKTGVPSRIYLIDTNGKTTGFIPKSEFRYKLERTKAFKMWFGDWENAPEGAGTSKILDEAGEPMMMYHGTNWTTRESMYMFKDDIDKETQGLNLYRRRFSQGNLFRGTWTSSSRKFSEDWSNETSAGEYAQQVVIPVYVKSTNPFDPRNPEHASRLLNYLENGYSVDAGINAFIPTRDMRVAMEFGFYDWSYFETTAPEFPAMGSAFEQKDEVARRKEFFAKHPYPILEAIINLGFDGLWAREKGLGFPGSIESRPKNFVQELEIIRRSDDKSTEKRTIENLKEDVREYNNNSTWNHLSFRSDGIKSSANTGKFKADKRKTFKPAQEAQRFVNYVTRNRKTLWNEFQKGGKTYASYDSRENLVSYAYSDPRTLARAGIEKTEMRNGVVFFSARSVEGVRSPDRKPTDILGAAMPRQFGVRIKDKMQADAYEKLKNLTYEPIPDSMVQEEAEAYLEKHGIRGAMDATISKSSPLEHGSRELLAQIIILKLNDQYKKTKDARVLEELIDYTDTFLAITSEAGRALRQLSFWSKLSPEGMLMLYKKKLDESNRETRDRFNEFFAKVKRELSTLPAEALDKALKSMEGLISKADKAAEESRKKLATSNTMTFWENFSKQIGDSLVQKSQEQLNIAEEELARTAGGEATPEGELARNKVNNAKTINQAAQEMSRNIKQMFLALAREQGKNIRDPRVLTDEEFANKTDEEIAKIQQAERDSKQAQKFTDMLARWPKALQAWQTATDAIRAQTSVNPELATMFQSFLDLTLETPFTMPQLKRFLSLRGVKLEDLIREHYQEGKLANNAYSLAKEMVEEAGLGAWEEEIGSEVTTPLEPVAEGEEPKPLTKKLPSLSERLTQALALQIEKYAETESAKKLNRLIDSYADKRLEPSLKRFMKRMVQYQALGLFNNAYAWNEFQKQEGLDKVKPEVVNQLLDIMGKAEKLVGFRKEEAYADALSLITYHTNTGFWNFTKSWWYLSILSGFTTQIANIAGNAYNTMLLTVPTIGKHLIAGTVNPAESKAIVKQMFRAMSLSLQDFGYLLTTGRVGTRKSDNPFFSQASTDYFEVIAKNTPYRAARISATSAAMVRRVMSAVDMMFYNFNKEVYLFDSAYNDAKKSGLKGSEAVAKALDMTFRSSEALQSAQSLAEKEGYVIDAEGTVERAKQKIEQSIRIQEIIDANVTGSEESSRVAIGAQVYGEELTYNEEPKGFLGALHRSISSLTVKYGLVSVPIPFTKIVANVWNQGLDATGLGIFRSGKLAHGKLAKAFPFLKVLERLEMKGLKGSADEVQAQKDMMFARGFNALASVGIITLLDRVLCGQYETYGFELCVNGPGPKEPAQKELLKNRLGWKPNSLFIRTPGIDGIYLSYMLSPLAIPLAGVGLLKDNEIYNYYAKKSPKDASLALAHRLLTVPMEMNFLSGLGDLFEILSPNNPETALAKAKSFLSRMGSAMVVPNFFRDVDQLIVSSLPGVLNPRTAREDIIQAAFISNTPIIRQMYGTAELDILGQPIEMTSRVASIAGKDALVDVLIQKNALPTAPKKDKLLGLVPMDDTQYAEYREYRAKQLGEDLNTPEMIETLSRMEPGMAQLYVQRYTQKASQLAKAKILKGNSEILKEARETKAKQIR